MKNGMTGLVIAGALATMLGSSAAAAKTSQTSKQVSCNGTNDCKGKGNCKGSSHDCKGQNDCKGQSFTMEKDAKNCEAKGGKVAQNEPMKKM
jgi:hypothetical protein